MNIVINLHKYRLFSESQVLLIEKILSKFYLFFASDQK